MQVHRNAAMKNKKQKPQGKSGKVEKVAVDKRVMKDAKKAAKGDASLLKILGARKVRVKDSRYDPPR